MTEVAQGLLARSVKKTFFAMLRRTEDASLLQEKLSDHLEWMIGEEKQGRIFLSGNAESGDGVTLSGITIIRAESVEESKAIADRDPLVICGAVTYSLHRWSVNEGSLALGLNLSDSSFSMG